MKPITKAELFRLAAMPFLCEMIPDNWEDMEEQDSYDWLKDNAWGNMKNCRGQDLYQYISDMAECTRNFLHEHGIEVI